MEGISIGEIAVAVSFLVTLISGIGYLNKHLKEWIAKALDGQLDSINKTMGDLRTRIDGVDMETCKNFLVARLSEIEKGSLSEIEQERFWEQYQHYEQIGGNSYIKRKVEQLKAEGKL